MAKIINNPDEQPRDYSRVRAEAEQLKFASTAESRKRAMNSRYARFSLKDVYSLPGDRTNNTPATKKDAKQKNRIERDLAQTTYLLSLPKTGGLPIAVDEYGNADVVSTLAIMTHYRYISASNRKPKA